MKRKLLVGVGAVSGLLVLWVGGIALTGVVASSRVPVDLPPFSIYQHGDVAMLAQGTWVIEGHDQGNPLQTTKIFCEKERRTCTVAHAEVSISGSYKFLNVDSRELPITEWGKGHVVFTDEGRGCERYIYTLDANTKSVTGVRRKREKAELIDPACKTLQSNELRMTLKNGTEVHSDLIKKATPAWGEVLLAPLSLLFSM